MFDQDTYIKEMCKHAAPLIKKMLGHGVSFLHEDPSGLENIIFYTRNLDVPISYRLFYKISGPALAPKEFYECVIWPILANKFKNVLMNAAIFNKWDADVIIEDHKIAVLWNGKWHYDKITLAHSVKQVQNRDTIKIKEIIKAGYIPYIIKDMGRENKKFVEQEFEKFKLSIIY